MKSRNDKFMLMTLLFGGATAILPFAVMRLWHGDWVIGLVDAAMIIGMLFLGFIARLSNKMEFVRVGVCVVALSGLLTVIYLKGVSVVFWAYPTLAATFFILPPRRAIILTLLIELVIAATIVNQTGIAEFFLIIITLLANNVFAYVFTIKMIHQRDQLARRNETLRDALTEIKTLRGIIPICSYCHNIRDDEGAWDEIEAYISKHSDAKFSHGICPKCFEKVKDKFNK